MEFTNLDCIIDYDEVKDMNEFEVLGYNMSIINKRNNIGKKLINMSEEEFNQNKDMYTEYKLLEQKTDEVRNFLWFKQGHIKMEIPEDADYIEVNSYIVLDDENTKSLRSKVKSLVKRLFNNHQ